MAETSIIKIIQKMVQDNESEEKIVLSLQSLGVPPEQAKRLLLIAQADTFTLLDSEIGKMVQEKLEEKKGQIEKDSQKFVQKTLDEKKKEMKIEMEKEFLVYKLNLSDAQKKFQSSVSETISKIAKLNEEVYLMSEDNKKTIETVEKDLTETKLKGVKLRRSVFRNILVSFAIICFAGSSILILTTLLGDYNIDKITGSITLALIGTAVIYLAANM